MDCHGAGGDRSFNSLIPDALDARCEFVVQTRWTEYTAMLEDGCDAALFVGQHARAGAERGVLSHTVSSTSWHELRFNGTPVGEVGINAALCGTWGCPVALVTGDDVVCAEAAGAARRPACARWRSRPGSAASAPATSPPPPLASGSSARRATRCSDLGERPGLRPRGAVHHRRGARHARPRRRVPQPRRRDADGSAQRREPRADRGGTPGARSTSDAQQKFTRSAYTESFVAHEHDRHRRAGRVGGDRRRQQHLHVRRRERRAAGAALDARTRARRWRRP